MANWCSNSVAFEGNETALEQVRLEFIKMQILENEENCGQLPEFILDKKRGYFFDIFIGRWRLHLQLPNKMVTQY